MAQLRNELVIEGKLVRYEMKVVKDFSIGTGSIARSFGKDKPVAFFDFEIWNPDSDLDAALQNAASQEADARPYVRVTGSLKQDVWEKDGKVNRKIKITATNVEGFVPEFKEQPVTHKTQVRPNAAKPAVVQPTKQVFKSKTFVKPQPKPVAAQEDDNIPF